MYFTIPTTTTTTAVAIVAMAAAQFALAPIMVAAAPLARSQADDLASGQHAQKLNRQYQTVTVEHSCTDGETACIAGNFATCSPEKDWEVAPCPKDLNCYAVPGAGKNSTYTTCTKEEDALAQIKDTGVKGGIYGDDSSDDNKNNEGRGGENGSSTTTTTADKYGAPTASPTGTSATASSDIPKFNIPVGGDFSSILETAVSTAETTSTQNATLSGTTTTPATATESGSSTPCTTEDGATATATDSGQSVIFVTTTVTVAPTDCAGTSSIAQGSGGTTPYLVTYTTHPFSPIPETTTTPASSDSGTPADGYQTASTSSLTSSASSASQTAPLYGTVGTTTTDTQPEYPSEAAPSSTTSSGDASIPPLAPAPTPPVGPVSVLPIHTIPA